MKSAPLRYRAAADMAEAVACLAAGDGEVRPLAGGQSIGPMMALRLAQPAELVDLGRIAALTGHRIDGERLCIGAGVTHARIEDGALPADATRGLLPAVAAGIAYRAVRNRGTFGGSLALADPKADWVATTTLLDARFTLEGPSGRREVDVATYFIAPYTTTLSEDELLVEVAVPVLTAQARWAYRKACRKPGEFADAIVGLLDDPGRGLRRVVFGALGRMPVGLDVAAWPASDPAPLLDAADLTDPDERQLHGALLRRALADLTRTSA